MNKKTRMILTFLMVLSMLVLTACVAEAPAESKAAEADQAIEAEETVEVVEDNYPEREIRVVVPYSPGGTMDTAARQIQNAFAERLGKPIVIENRDGASGQLGLTLAYNEKQDGYVLAGMPTPHLEFMLTLKDTEFEFEDLEFIGGLTADITCIRVRNDAPWDTMQDLIDDAKSRPGEITFGVSSITSDNYLGIKTIEKATGVTFNTVDFGGGSPARIALVGGKIDAVHTNVFSSLHIKDDTKVLAVQWENNPFESITDNAPTVNEALDVDVPALSTGTFFLTTKEFKDQYPDRYNKLVVAFKEAVEDEAFITMMKDLGEYEKIIYSTPDEIKAKLQSTLNAVDSYKDLWD